jgi:hypothetical protein
MSEPLLQQSEPTIADVLSAIEGLHFTVDQLISVMQGTRTDIVEMRGTLLRLEGGVKLALNQLPIAEVERRPARVRKRLEVESQ